jgi:hypothetical protein
VRTVLHGSGSVRKEDTSPHYRGGIRLRYEWFLEDEWDKRYKFYRNINVAHAFEGTYLEAEAREERRRKADLDE